MTSQENYANDYAKDSADAGKDRLRDMADAATDKVKDVAQSAGKFAEQVLEYGEKAQDAVSNFKPYVEKSMKEQPMATLGVAAVSDLYSALSGRSRIPPRIRLGQ